MKIWIFLLYNSYVYGSAIPIFLYFFSLIMIWRWVEFEKNPWWQSLGWYYSVGWNLGCGAPPIWAGWDQKYFSHLINSQKSLMGPNFGKIPEIEVPYVLMTWKICLLRKLSCIHFLSPIWEKNSIYIWVRLSFFVSEQKKHCLKLATLNSS